MVDRSIQEVIRRYIRAVKQSGIHAEAAILFGSHARGEANEFSDIDLVVIAPELDNLRDTLLIEKLWELRATTDSRIEPIACGVKEWEESDDRPILEYARAEGVTISIEN